MKTVSPTRIRIDFQVREILPIGQDETDARFVNMSEEVDVTKIKDFFERCGLGVDMLFNAPSMQTIGMIKIRYPSPNSKINAIILHRELCGTSLKEAKDAIDVAWMTGCAIMSAKQGDEVEFVLKRHAEIGIKDVYVEYCTSAQALGAPCHTYKPKVF